MNLSELVRYEDKHLERNEDFFAPARQTVGSSRWVGFLVKPSAEPQAVLKDLMSLRPFQSFPETMGWYACEAEGYSSSPQTLSVILQEQGGRVLWRGEVRTVPGQLAPIHLAWPHPNVWSDSSIDLVFHLAPEAAPVFVAVSRLLRRSDLINRIKGNGVEIGPGMSPQVLPSKDTSVLYIDEMTKADWEKTYEYKRDKWEAMSVQIDFSLYRADGALNLPVEDGSLDFVFGSHVFEHLVNPLQHLKHWLSKLKSGGKIFMIIPVADASPDYRHGVSVLRDFTDEFASEEVLPGKRQYDRVFGSKAAKAMDERRSLHVHFYNPKSLADLLHHAQNNLEVRRFAIEHHDNYRELFFCVEKA